MAVVCRSVCGEIWRAAREGQHADALATEACRRCSIPARVGGLLGEDRRLGVSVKARKPGAQLPGGALPERDDPFLAPLALGGGGGAVEERVSDACRPTSSETRGAAVVEDGEEHRVALAAPSGAVGRLEQRLDLIAGEEVERGPVEALGWRWRGRVRRRAAPPALAARRSASTSGSR